MKSMVRYTLKPECVEENERLVRRVYEELRTVAPPGLRYATYRVAGGLGYVHIASTEGDVDHGMLTSLPSFKAFVAGVRERCTEPPVVVELTPIGAYGLTDA